MKSASIPAPALAVPKPRGNAVLWGGLVLLAALVAIGALIVGLARSCAVHLAPQVELFAIYVVMALVLVFRPEGLFQRTQTRKI